MVRSTSILTSLALACSLAGAQTAEPSKPLTADTGNQEAPLASPESKQQKPSGTSLFFDVQDKSLKISAPFIRYDMKTSKGTSLDFGNGLIFNDDSLKASIENNELQISWDTSLVPSGDLSIISEQGKELWKRSLTGDGTWSSKELTGIGAPSWVNGDKFRFCLRSEVAKGYANLCTASYALVLDEKGLQMGRTRSEADARIIFQNEEKKDLKGSFEVAADSPVQFLATLKSNASYDFVSEPITPVIKDMVQSEKSDSVLLKGEMPRPLKHESSIIDRENYSRLTRKMGFEKTIAELPELWQMELPSKGAQLSLPGKSGGVFIYDLLIQDAPKESERMFLSVAATSGTYLSQDQHQLIDSQGNIHIWNYSAPEKWTEGKAVYEKSYLDVYRGASREASLRLTGVSTNEGTFIIMGEGHVSWWFNDLFGWQNSLLSKQRWGVSAKYFSSLMDFPVSIGNDQTEDVKLSALEADFRYRFTPGLWERDETVGLIGAFESVSLGTDNVPKMGVGLFWARSMPRSIDKWFSKLPYMNHPKWVDMELITYLASTDSDVKLQGDFALNFHGKVLWTPSFFGEAGFGMKNYQYEFQSTGYGAKITTFYGTLGLGINF